MQGYVESGEQQIHVELIDNEVQNPEEQEYLIVTEEELASDGQIFDIEKQFKSLNFVQ